MDLIKTDQILVAYSNSLKHASDVLGINVMRAGDTLAAWLREHHVCCDRSDSAACEHVFHDYNLAMEKAVDDFVAARASRIAIMERYRAESEKTLEQLVDMCFLEVGD